MLYIYNEIDTPFVINAAGISQTHKMEVPKKNGKVKTVRSKFVVRLEDVENFPLLNGVDSQEVGPTSGLTKDEFYMVRIYGGDTAVNFDDMNMSPHIRFPKNGFNRNVIFAAINLNGGKITDFKNNGYYLLKYLLINDTFVFAVSSNNNVSAPLEVCISTTEGKMNRYLFTPDSEGVTVTKNEVGLEVNPYFEKAFKIRRFIPNKPTHLIFCREDLKTKLSTAFGDKLNKHEIVYYTDYRSLKKSIDVFLKKGYTAVSIFSDKPIDTNDKKCREGLTGDYNNLYNNFHVLHIVGNDGNVTAKAKKKGLRGTKPKKKKNFKAKGKKPFGKRPNNKNGKRPFKGGVGKNKNHLSLDKPRGNKLGHKSGKYNKPNKGYRPNTANKGRSYNNNNR